MKRIRVLTAVVLAALCFGAIPGTSSARPYFVRTVPINASGVSDVVYESGLVFGSQMQSGKVFAVDPVAGAILATLTVDVSRTHAMAADKVNHRVYVTNYDAGTLSVINSAANPPVLLSTIPVGAHPVAVDVDPTSRRVFIGQCCEESRTIVAVDDSVTPPVVLATVLVGQGPDHLAVDTTSGMVYVANYDSASVSVVAGRATPPVQVGFVELPKNPNDQRPLRPNALAIDPETGYLVVSCGDLTAEQHQVEVIDTATGKSKASINTGMFIAHDVNIDTVKDVVWFTLPTNRFGNLWSVNIAPAVVGLVGPRASVVSPNFANFTLDDTTARLFGAGQDSIVVLEDDEEIPVVSFTATTAAVASNVPNAPQANIKIEGVATDDRAGIAGVTLIFTLIPTNILNEANEGVRRIESIQNAVTVCEDTPRRDCVWTKVPRDAGVYSVHAIAYDYSGNKGETAEDLIVVVL